MSPKRFKIHIMRKLLFIIAIISTLMANAQEFNKWFSDSTLRLCYTFAGDANKQKIYVDELRQSPRWYGKRQHMSEVPLMGNGDIVARDRKSGAVIYRHSFSSLFQEWVCTDEAKKTSKAFENVFLMPTPLDTTDVTVTLRDAHQQVTATMTHTVVPSDILIVRDGEKNVTPYTTLQAAKDSTRCIRVAFVAEGYTAEEMDQYVARCREAMDAMFNHEPFKSMRDRFNMVAVLSPSRDSGVSVPRNNDWRDTALGSHFDTFYSNRYLTTLHLKTLHNLLAGIPYEHVIILANTDTYGGGGIYNSYTLTYTGGQHFRPVVVHEFGHSFAGLADEYPYGNDDPQYFSDTEPWEPNLTTLKDFASKWQDMVPKGTKIPTPLSKEEEDNTDHVGVYEGGGYLEKGVYRPVPNCRMRTNKVPEFCPVCKRHIERLIDFYTK